MNVWFYISIISIPIFIGILFAVSFFMIKDREDARLAKALGFFICSPDSIISFAIIFILMIFTVIVLQLLAYSDLYDKTEACMPILYYFGGNKDGCKQIIARNADIQTHLSNVQSQINNMKDYKTQLDNKSNNKNKIGIFEEFVGNSKHSISTVSSSFSQIMDEFRNTYKSYVKQVIIYGIKVYRDIFLPWMKK